LQADTARCFRERFGAPLVQEYGLSEAGIVSLNLACPERTESVGTPIANVSLRIVDPADASRELPAGAVGEVLVRRAFPPTAYLDHPDESRATFTPYGVRTGDLGCIDAVGLLTLTGRIKSMINVAGAKVAPKEVEEALLWHPAVDEAIVFGVPSPELGEAVTAVVVLHAAGITSESALIAHCRERLSAYKVPATVYVLPELPRTLSGKPDVPRIRELVSSDAAAATGRQP
jgi:long-chain acyl-CoA synthetase